jgi:gamma-glutamylputrescine oxidase
MAKIEFPLNQVFWYLQTINKIKPLTSDIKADVVVVGGGFAGLHAAQSFHAQGAKVALLEKYFCGSGASGKSSGFITPTAELGIDHYHAAYGSAKAKQMWNFVTHGVELIKHNIKKYGISCDYHDLPTVVLANSKKAFKDLETEKKVRDELEFQGILHSKEQTRKLINSDGYYGALSYDDTFGMNPTAYAQSLKNILLQEGVLIYEETPAIGIESHSVKTPYGSVQAAQIVLCVDHHLPDFNMLKKLVYHVQTFIMISSPLTDMQMKKIFPGDLIMAWDTDLIYQYFRPIAQNRFLIGGGTYFSSFSPFELYNWPGIYKKLTRYCQIKFPEVKLNFEYMYPGMLGISKDLEPIAGRDQNNSHIYYVTAATGLPWAAALGNYSAEHIMQDRTDMDEFFTPNRSFFIGGLLQSVLRNPISFGLSNLYSSKIRG